MPVIAVLGRLRQEDHKFKTSLGYISRICLKKKKIKTTPKSKPNQNNNNKIPLSNQDK
jgi:hypothetical protein